jgi:hypothetical protein
MSKISVTKIASRKKKVNVEVEPPEWRQYLFA